MENENDTEQVQEDNEDLLAEINTRIEKFFESQQYLSSRNELDSFISAIDLMELWNSKEELDTIWEFISKYSKDSKIDCEGVKKGFNDFFYGDNTEDLQDDSTSLKNERKESKDLLLTRLSRISNRAIRSKSGNKLAINRYKQRAIEEYESFDNESLIQFKKIFTLLKITKSKGKINFDELKEICANHKFITIDINDIWKYLSFLVNEENIQNFENKTELEINSDIMEEVDSFISNKLANEDIEYDSDNLDEEEIAYKKEDLQEIMIDLIEEIIKQEIKIDENGKVINQLNEEMRNINENEVENLKEAINRKSSYIDEYLTKTHKESESNLKKLQSLKTNILKVGDIIKVKDEEFKNLYEKYNNNQQLDIDEETERLIDENVMLNQIKEKKENEIEQLLEEKKEMKKEYNNILMQYENSIREKNELTQEISELKIDNYKLKGDYDKLLNDVINKIEREKKNKKNAKVDNSSYENQIKEIKSINNAKIDEGEKISRKKDIFNNMDNEKLINYVIEIELINQTLSNEKNKNDKKIHELTQQNVDLNNLMKVIKDRNIDLEEQAKNLQKKIENLNTDIQNNEMFRPSIAMNSQVRISRLSKLNTSGMNSIKFNIHNSGNFGGKKIIEKFKLKDKNINQKKVNSSNLNHAQKINMELYGVEEVLNEEEDQENKKKENMGITSNSGVEFGSKENDNENIGIGGKKEFNIDSNNNKVNAEFYNDINGGMIFDGNIYESDINLSQQGNNFDIKNNNNISIQNEDNMKNSKNKNQAQSNLFFEAKPQNNNLDIKNVNSDNIDDFINQKMNNLIGEMENDESDDKTGNVSNKNDDNLKINEIQNEKSININNIKNDYDIIKKDGNSNLEINKIDNAIVNGNNNNIVDKNSENKIQNGGLNKDKDNSSSKQILSSGNSNNINLVGLEKNDENKLNDKSNQNEIIINKSNDKNKNNQIGINSNAFRMKPNRDSDDFKLDLYSNLNFSESSGKPINYNRLSKAELNQLRNNNYDYYSLFQEDCVQRKLKEEKDNCNEFNIYSDLIFYLTEKKHLSKRYIIITPSHIYIIEPKDMVFSRIIKKENILSFQISNKNFNIIMFQIRGGNNILIQTLRRMDLLSYLRDNYRNGKSLVKIKYEDKFEINIKGKMTHILVQDKIFSELSNFDGAQKIGYLFVKKEYIVTFFSEKFFILTSIGLIMFDDPSSPPSKLYPIIGSKIEKLEGTRYGRENCFKVTLLSGKVKVFSTRKKREMESWLNEFAKVNNEFKQKMNQIDTISKKIIDN